jgi:Domain of unknown function (DUF5615)
MARLYADEDFDYPVVKELRSLGHDVVTAQEAGQAGQRLPDPAVLAFAVAQGRALLESNKPVPRGGIIGLNSFRQTRRCPGGRRRLPASIFVFTRFSHGACDLVAATLLP